MPPGIVRLTPDSTRSPRWIGYTGVRASKSMSNVEFQGVSKSYPIYDSPGDRLKELITPRRYQFHRDFWALRDVSFDIRRGETFCIVGENGPLVLTRPGDFSLKSPLVREAEGG